MLITELTADCLYVDQSSWKVVHLEFLVVHTDLCAIQFRLGTSPVIMAGFVGLARGVTKGAKFPGRRTTARLTTISQVLSSIQYICFRKTSGSNMGAPNLLLAPGAI